MPPPATPLPAGFGLILDRSVRRPSPEELLGGSPGTLIRLSKAGARLLEGWLAGEPIGPSEAEGLLARRLVDAGIAHPVPPSPTAPGVPEACDITVVVPVRDRRLALARTLAAIDRARLVPAAVVVVDDGSEPPIDSKEIERQGLRLIRRPEAGGPAAARNTGWRSTETGMVAFLDDDCEPGAGWLDALLPHFADPCVGAVAPRVVADEGLGLLDRYERWRSPLDLGPWPAPVRPGSRVPYVPTAALVVRRAALAQAGGFEETLRHGEDVDFVWRLEGLGWRVRYEPEAVVTHPSRANLRAWLEQRFSYGRSAAPLAARHPRSAAPLALNTSSAAAWALALSGHPVGGAAVAAASCALLARRAGGSPATKALLATAVAEAHLRTGLGLLGAVRRSWLPPALAMAVAAARRRGPLPLAALLAGLGMPPLLEWAVDRPAVGPLQWWALRLADDLAYQAGVWAGACRACSMAPLLPRWQGSLRRAGHLDGRDPLPPAKSPDLGQEVAEVAEEDPEGSRA